MKRMLFILVILTVSMSNAQKLTPKDAFLEKWENSKIYLIEVAEAMPEEFYDFKPTDRQMSFKEQLVHIKGNMDWLSNSYFTSETFKREKTALPASKEETIALVSAAFDATLEIIKNTSEEKLKEIVDFFSGEKSKLQILNLLQDHVTHHRGQLIVYLNLNDIKPPSYSGW